MTGGRARAPLSCAALIAALWFAPPSIAASVPADAGAPASTADGGAAAPVGPGWKPRPYPPPPFEDEVLIVLCVAGLSALAGALARPKASP